MELLRAMAGGAKVELDEISFCAGVIGGLIILCAAAQYATFSGASDLLLKFRPSSLSNCEGGIADVRAGAAAGSSTVISGALLTGITSSSKLSS